VPSRVEWDEFEVIGQPLRLVRPKVERCTRDTLRVARAFIHNRTGALSESGHEFTFEDLAAGTLDGEVNFTSDIALAVHEGTSAHIIRPRPPRRSLKFYWPKVGMTVFPRLVHHPGARPNQYLTDALRIVGRALGFKVTINVRRRTQQTAGQRRGA